MFIWRFTSLMTTRNHRMTWVRGALISAAVITLFALVKHDSANWALVLYVDGLLGLTLGSLPFAGAMRELSVQYAGGSLPRNVPGKAMNRWFWLSILFIAALLTVEFVLWGPGK